MVTNRRKRKQPELTLIDKEAAIVKALAEAKANEPEADPEVPPYEIDPDVDIEFQLSEAKSAITGLQMGRLQLKNRYRVNKYQLKNEQAAQACVEDLVRQEAAISDWQNTVKIIEAEIERRKQEADQ